MRLLFLYVLSFDVLSLPQWMVLAYLASCILYIMKFYFVFTWFEKFKISIYQNIISLKHWSLRYINEHYSSDWLNVIRYYERLDCCIYMYQFVRITCQSAMSFKSLQNVLNYSKRPCFNVEGKVYLFFRPQKRARNLHSSW